MIEHIYYNLILNTRLESWHLTVLYALDQQHLTATMEQLVATLAEPSSGEGLEGLTAVWRVPELVQWTGVAGGAASGADLTGA